jgi:hypothetical protein
MNPLVFAGLFLLASLNLIGAGPLPPMRFLLDSTCTRFHLGVLHGDAELRRVLLEVHASGTRGVENGCGVYQRNALVLLNARRWRILALRKSFPRGTHWFHYTWVHSITWVSPAVMCVSRRGSKRVLSMALCARASSSS